MLEVASEPLGRERSPEGDLARAGGLAGPVGELVGVRGEGGLLAVDGGGVCEEEDLGGVRVCTVLWEKGKGGGGVGAG